MARWGFAVCVLRALMTAMWMLLCARLARWPPLDNNPDMESGYSWLLAKMRVKPDKECRLEGL